MPSSIPPPWRTTAQIDEEYAVCPAMHMGVEQAVWADLYYEFVDMNKEINARSPGGNRRAKMLWTLCEAKRDV